MIGGVPDNFTVSARLGDGPLVEADEYDCAFFDKRSKFVHYCPSTFILNNLEFDHADIFDDLKEIQKQYGIHRRRRRMAGEKTTPDASGFEVYLHDEPVGAVSWQLVGEHNMHNALMVIAAVRHVGVQPADACRALDRFINARRQCPPAVET